MRIVHLSDIHFWQYEINPLRLLGKRALGMASLVMGRAHRFDLGRMPALVDHVTRLRPDHILITGDITTTALPAEFRAAKAAMAGWLGDPARVTLVPGNHDRYTLYAHRSRRFERFFGEFCGAHTFPWVRRLDPQTAILGLDPTRFGVTARGKFPKTHLERASQILTDAGPIERLVVACHYPAAAPPERARADARHPLLDRGRFVEWLGTLGPHIFCCGHLHTPWAFRPPNIPNQLSLNAGAPLLRDRSERFAPSFLEISLDGLSVRVTQHERDADRWQARTTYEFTNLFARQ